MRIFFGLLFATFINILMDIFGYFLVANSFLSNYAPANVTDPTAQKYIWTFFLNQASLKEAQKGSYTTS